MQDQVKETHYSLLGVSTTANDAEVRQAFRKLAFKCHPDKNPGREAESTEEFRKVAEAYEVLKDVEKRVKYDAELQRRQPREDVFSSYVSYGFHSDPFRSFQRVFTASRSTYSPRFCATTFFGSVFDDWGNTSNFEQSSWQTSGFGFNTHPEHGSPRWNVRISSGETDTEGSSDESEQEGSSRYSRPVRFSKPASQRTEPRRQSPIKRKRQSTPEVIVIEESENDDDVIIIDEEEKMEGRPAKRLKRSSSQDCIIIEQDDSSFMKSHFDIPQTVPEDLTTNASPTNKEFLRSSADLSTVEPGVVTIEVTN